MKWSYLFWLNYPATYTNFDQISCLDLNLKEVAAARCHGLVTDDGFESISVAYSHSHGPHILIDVFLFLLIVAFVPCVGGLLLRPTAVGQGGDIVSSIDDLIRLMIAAEKAFPVRRSLAMRLQTAVLMFEFNGLAT